MTAYLQRLYDAAAAAPVSAPPVPAQRSSSPVVAADQRLASAAYAGSFVLGLPGEPEPDPGFAPLPGDLVLPPVARVERSAPDDAVGFVPPRNPVAEPPTFRDVRPLDPQIGPDLVALPPARPLDADHEPARRTVPPVQSANEALLVTLAPPMPEPGRTYDRVGPDRRPATEVVASPAPRVVSEPAYLPPVARVEPLRAAPRPVEPMNPVTTREDTVAVPPQLHPAPRAAPEPLPPAPLDARSGDLAAQVRRLVREELAVAAPAPMPPTLEPATPTVRDAQQRSSRPTTAEAASVIGPLERPARSSTLYGLRLR